MPFVNPKLHKLSWDVTRYIGTARKCYLPFRVTLALPKSDILDRIRTLPNKVLDTPAKITTRNCFVVAKWTIRVQMLRLKMRKCWRCDGFGNATKETDEAVEFSFQW